MQVRLMGKGKTTWMKQEAPRIRDKRVPTTLPQNEHRTHRIAGIDRRCIAPKFASLQLMFFEID
jgi:hypothetical protein